MNEGLRLILKDGMEIENGRAGYTDRVLWLWMPGMSMQGAAAIVFDPEKTGKIIFRYGNMQDEYEGFTHCIRILEEENDIAVCMTREAE